jgi:hypothetical protein
MICAGWWVQNWPLSSLELRLARDDESLSPGYPAPRRIQTDARLTLKVPLEVTERCRQNVNATEANSG